MQKYIYKYIYVSSPSWLSSFQVQKDQPISRSNMEIWRMAKDRVCSAHQLLCSRSSRLLHCP